MPWGANEASLACEVRHRDRNTENKQQQPNNCTLPPSPVSFSSVCLSSFRSLFFSFLFWIFFRRSFICRSAMVTERSTCVYVCDVQDPSGYQSALPEWKCEGPRTSHTDRHLKKNLKDAFLFFINYVKLICIYLPLFPH